MVMADFIQSMQSYYMLCSLHTTWLHYVVLYNSMHKEFIVHKIEFIKKSHILYIYIVLNTQCSTYGM